MSERPDKPTAVRLSPDDLSRLDAVRAEMARAAGLDGAGGVSRHAAILAALRLGLDALEAKHAPRARSRRR